MKIDFPGLSDINEKYEDLKNKNKEKACRIYNKG